MYVYEHITQMLHNDMQNEYYVNLFLVKNEKAANCFLTTVIIKTPLC
jgi:hypothetical protein